MCVGNPVLCGDRRDSPPPPRAKGAGQVPVLPWSVVLVLAFPLALLLLPWTTVAATPGGDLPLPYRGTGRGAEIMDSPHLFACTTCHRPAGTRAEEGYPLQEDTIALCRRCHVPVHFHRVGMAPPLEEKMDSRVWLPLGKGSRKGQVVCITCHYIHADRYRPALLRGDAEDRETRGQNLCPACHTRRPAFPDPHSGDREACPFCHPSPGSGEGEGPEPAGANLLSGCGFCHNGQESDHCLALNPFTTETDPQALANLGIPLDSSGFTCVSCHDPHEKGGTGARMLRAAFLSLASSSSSINPHWKDVMCISCHCCRPTEGQLLCLNAGDVETMCTRCHDGFHARRDIHPVGVVPSADVEIPDSLPLLEGKVTCLTCHDSSLQEGGEGKTSLREQNPDFLRGGFSARDAFCFRCHRPESYKRMNAHSQVDEGGSLKVQSCLFCHSSFPDRGRWSIESAAFDDETLDGYCTCCHDGYVDNHPVGGTTWLFPLRRCWRS